MQRTESDPIIRLRDVSKSYRAGEVVVPVLKSASLAVEEGKLLVLFGVSGSGKTTLLNLIGALDRVDEGSIVVDDEELSTLSEKKLTEFRRRKLGFVFQFYNLLPTLTAKENVESAIELLPIGRKEVEARAVQYLGKVGLGDKLEKYPDQLSGGEQQRVAIARALAKEPRVLLADEPTGNLDEKSGARVTDLLREMTRSTGTTTIIASHNPRLKEIADDVLSIAGQQVLRAG